MRTVQNRALRRAAAERTQSAFGNAAPIYNAAAGEAMDPRALEDAGPAV